MVLSMLQSNWTQIKFTPLGAFPSGKDKNIIGIVQSYAPPHINHKSIRQPIFTPLFLNWLYYCNNDDQWQVSFKLHDATGHWLAISIFSFIEQTLPDIQDHDLLACFDVQPFQGREGIEAWVSTPREPFIVWRLIHPGEIKLIFNNCPHTLLDPKCILPSPSFQHLVSFLKKIFSPPSSFNHDHSSKPEDPKPLLPIVVPKLCINLFEKIVTDLPDYAFIVAARILHISTEKKSNATRSTIYLCDQTGPIVLNYKGTQYNSIGILPEDLPTRSSCTTAVLPLTTYQENARVFKNEYIGNWYTISPLIIYKNSKRIVLRVDKGYRIHLKLFDPNRLPLLSEELRLKSQPTVDTGLTFPMNLRKKDQNLTQPLTPTFSMPPRKKDETSFKPSLDRSEQMESIEGIKEVENLENRKRTISEPTQSSISIEPSKYIISVSQLSVPINYEPISLNKILTHSTEVTKFYTECQVVYFWPEDIKNFCVPYCINSGLSLFNQPGNNQAIQCKSCTEKKINCLKNMQYYFQLIIKDHTKTYLAINVIGEEAINFLIDLPPCDLSMNLEIQEKLRRKIYALMRHGHVFKCCIYSYINEGPERCRKFRLFNTKMI